VREGGLLERASKIHFTDLFHKVTSHSRVPGGFTGCKMCPVFLFILATAAASNGLTLRRFNNTALVGSASSTAVVSNLENIEAFDEGTRGRPAGLLLTGQLAPPKAGRYGFEVIFTPVSADFETRQPIPHD
jgi:hypothetical protein